MLDHYFSIAEIADRLGVSRWKIRKEITDGRLDAIRVTDRGDYRITEQALRDWLDRQKQGSPPAA